MDKKTKRKVSKKKVIIALIILIIIVGGVIGGYLLLNQNTKENKIIKIESTDTIEGYDYVLNSNATKYYKKLFKELKNVLESDEVNEAEYADLVVKLFIADFYNLDNKINKNDVGGEQYVYKDFREDFKLLATTSIYKHVENNLYGDRKQELPVVTNVSTEKKDSIEFKYGDKIDEKAYVIAFEIEYEKDLDYQDKGTLTLIHNDKKLEVAVLEE